MPQTTRAGKSGVAVPVLGINQSKLVAEHRKKTTLNTIEKQMSIDSTTKVVPRTSESYQRNISQSAWNKIRLVELKKKDRLNFNL